MKIISKRGQAKTPATTPPAYKAEAEFVEYYIISGGQVPMTPEELKAIEDIFENIRKQLEGLNLRTTVYDGCFW